MARIRYLKPDFFKDEDIKELPFQTRLVFQGLWIHADREGRGEDRPERLKVEIMPYENVNMDDELSLLSKPKNHSNKPYIIRYEVGGQKYYQILEWNKHQKPHPTERKSVIPPVPKEMLSKLSLTVKNTLKQSGEGNGEGNGEGKDGTPVPLNTFLEKWNNSGLPCIRGITGQRKKHIAARLSEQEFVNNYDIIISKTKESDFLTGRTPSATHPNFKATFDWVIVNDTNYVKILEGKYDNRKSRGDV